MKVLKKANQQNVILNKDFYTEYKIKMLLEERKICFFNEDLNECYDYLTYSKFYEEPCLRLFLEKGDEIKVECVEGHYRNVLIKNNKEKYFVIL